MGKPISYSEAELAFIKAHCQLPRKEATKRFNQAFKRQVSVANIAALCKRHGWFTGRDGRFSKGCESWNKGKSGYMGANRTSFAKGHRPHNATFVGDERTTRDGYVKVKVKEPNCWKFKSRLVWEEAHGAVPVGSVIIYKDGDSLNCQLDNLVMVTRYELSTLNKLGYKKADGRIKPSLLALAKLRGMVSEREGHSV